jgi:hypothetical protein
MCFHPIDLFFKIPHETKIKLQDLGLLTVKNHLLSIQFVKNICRLKHLAMHS